MSDRPWLSSLVSGRRKKVEVKGKDNDSMT
jgi:hypothetical protein